MAPTISVELRGRILAFRGLNYSSSMAVSALQQENVIVSKRTVCRVWESVEKKSEKNSPVENERSNRGRPTIRTPTKIKKIGNFCSKDNPVSQRCLAKKLGVSQTTVNRLIHDNLGAVTRKKTKVHYISPKAILQRKERAYPFYQFISENLYYILSMDEAMLPLDYANGQTNFFYLTENDKDEGRVAPLAVQKQSFPLQRMFAAGFSHRGPTRLYVVPKQAKVNADLFIELILKPMVLVDIPKLYGADAGRVILHMDSASSHTAKKTIKWLESHRVKFIRKEQWLANSPEISPIDFFANGHLKTLLKGRHYTTEGGMLRAAKDEWHKIPLQYFQNAFNSWPARVLATHKARGNHAPEY